MEKEIEEIIVDFKKLEAGYQKHHSECENNIYPCLKCMQISFLRQALKDTLNSSTS